MFHTWPILLSAISSPSLVMRANQHGTILRRYYKEICPVAKQRMETYQAFPDYRLGRVGGHNNAISYANGVV